MTPKTREIWLVSFPFSNLTTTKLRPALVIATHRQEAIILGIFSKIPVGKFQETWILINEHHLEFKETGLTTVEKNIFN
jgi:mRNA interferase MazF